MIKNAKTAPSLLSILILPPMLGTLSIPYLSQCLRGILFPTWIHLHPTPSRLLFILVTDWVEQVLAVVAAEAGGRTKRTKQLWGRIPSVIGGFRRELLSVSFTKFSYLYNRRVPISPTHFRICLSWSPSRFYIFPRREIRRCYIWGRLFESYRCVGRTVSPSSPFLYRYLTFCYLFPD